MEPGGRVSNDQQFDQRGGNLIENNNLHHAIILLYELHQNTCHSVVARPHPPSQCHGKLHKQRNTIIQRPFYQFREQGWLI